MNLITQRQIIGEFFKTLAIDGGVGWINAASNYFTSDQELETYAWLGHVPQLREWIGGRLAKGLSENAYAIRNKHYEATIDFLLRDLRRDKTGQCMVRIREFAKRSMSHYASLLSALIAAGETGVCYDGNYFYDTTHSEGSSGTQSNLISVDISGLPAKVHGAAATAPSVEEMQISIALAIQQIVGFLDDQGEPMNEDASSFLVMTPVSLMNTSMQAVATPIQIDASQTALTALKQAFSVRAVPNPRLSSWTDSFTVFRADSEVKALIRQEETKPSLKIKGEGSEYEFDNDAHQYGIDTWREVGYGMWQMAVKVTMY